MGRIFSTKSASIGNQMYFRTGTPLLSTQNWDEFFRLSQPPEVFKCFLGRGHPYYRLKLGRLFPIKWTAIIARCISEREHLCINSKKDNFFERSASIHNHMYLKPNTLQLISNPVIIFEHHTKNIKCIYIQYILQLNITNSHHDHVKLNKST